MHIGSERFLGTFIRVIWLPLGSQPLFAPVRTPRASFGHSSTPCLLSAVFCPPESAPDIDHASHIPCHVPVGVTRRKSELDAVVGQHRVDLVGNSRDQGDQEGRSRCSSNSPGKLDEGEFAGAINGDIEVELAFGRPHLGNVDVEITASPPDTTGRAVNFMAAGCTADPRLFN